MTAISLLLIVALSALLFGTVETWSMAFIGALTVIAFLSVVVRLKQFDIKTSNVKGVFYAMLALIAFITFQLIPLPLVLLDKIHPNIKELTTITPDAIPSFHSISVYPFATGIEFAKLLVYLMFFTIPVIGIDKKDGIYTIIKGLALFGFLLSLFGIIQHAAWNGKIFWFRELTQGGTPFGPFVNRNHFAGFIGMIIPLTLGLALTSKTTDKKILFIFFCVVMSIALFFSLSRAGIISFFVGIVVFSIFLYGNFSKKRLIPVFLFLLVLGLYLLFLGISPIIERFAGTDITTEQRLFGWHGTLLAFKEYPIFGSGLGTFRYVFKIYQPEGNYSYWDHAHNDYLELLLEVGFIGIGICAVFLFFIAKAIIVKDWKQEDVYLNAGFISSIATMMVHSFFDFNMHIPSNAILLFLILGSAVSMARIIK